MKAKQGQSTRSAFADTDFKVSGWCGNRPKCVSVAVKSHGVAVRDTKDSSKTTLKFTRGEWKAFVKGVKAGEFDTA